MRSALVTTLLSIAPLLVGGASVAQSPTPLGCDSRCLSALSRLAPGMRVDIWSDNVRVQGRFTGLVTSQREVPRLVVRADDASGDTASRVIPADHLQSLNVRLSNAPLFAAYGAAGGVALGIEGALLDAIIGFFKALAESDRPVTTGGRVATIIALGTAGGALAGAMVGSASRRWEQRFARPADPGPPR
jgi:hypothetical protein